MNIKYRGNTYTLINATKDEGTKIDNIFLTFCNIESGVFCILNMNHNFYKNRGVSDFIVDEVILTKTEIKKILDFKEDGSL
jgi:hypothetical protein